MFNFVFICCSPSNARTLLSTIERWTMNNETVHQSCYNVIHIIVVNGEWWEKAPLYSVGLELIFGAKSSTATTITIYFEEKWIQWIRIPNVCMGVWMESIYHSLKLWVTDCTLAIKTEKLFGSNRQYVFRFRTGITCFSTSIQFRNFSNITFSLMVKNRI